jgi:hypothetical protein
MNTPNLPEDIGFGKLYGSLRGSLKAGAAWMFVVYLTDVPGDLLVRHHPEWPLFLRALIAVIPLAATLLYVRAMARWIGGMDEMHRRVILAAFVYAAVAYLFLNVAWDLLKRAGIADAIHQSTRLHFELSPFPNCTFTICFTYLLWSTIYVALNRRYQ